MKGKKKKRKESIYLLSYLFIILLTLPFITATYDYAGQDDYKRDFTRFNSVIDTDDITFTGKNINTQRLLPLIADLDSDGTNEIILMDGSSIKVLQMDVSALTLTTIDSFALQSDQAVSNMWLFNIDGDNDTEIIINGESDNMLHILQFNGTDLFNQSSFSSDLQNVSGLGESLLGCKAVNDCLFIQLPEGSGSPKMQSFNSTGFFGDIFTDVSSASRSCFSRVKDMQVKDIDKSDGDKEYIWTYVNLVAFNIEIYLRVTDTGGGIISQKNQSINMGDVLDKGICTAPDQTTGYDFYAGDTFTSPLVFDFVQGGDLEILLARKTDKDNFRIYYYDSNLNFVDEFPEVISLEKGDGLIKSNVFRADIFDDSGDLDFCVIGYDFQQGATNDFIELVCGSKESSGIETVTFDLELDELNQKYNLTSDYGVLNVLAHSIEASDSTGTEIVTSYGILLPELTGICRLTSDCGMSVLWENPKIDSTVVPVDYEGNGLSDLLVVSSDSNVIWYIDDGFTNTGGQIDGYEINPCVDATWKINTTLEVQITVDDVDGDDVSARAILYYGSDNVQDTGWSNNLSSDTNFIFSSSEWSVNQTISNGVLRLMGRDVENPTNHDTIDLIFSVSTNGVEFGDCTTTADGLIVSEAEAEDEEVFVETGVDQEDNVITNSIRVFTTPYGLSEIVIWIFLMGLVAIAIWTGSDKATMNPHMAMGLIVFVEVLMVLLGIYLGFISVGLIIVITVIGLIVMGLWLSRRITSTSSN